MSLRSACSLLILFVGANSLVQFSQSTLYDIYDLQGVNEVALSRCDNGCFIFAAIQGTAQDPYMSNLVVHDYASGKDQSIAAIAEQYREGQKVPYDVVNKGRYSILNINSSNAQAADVAVWVIDRKAVNSTDFEIYDASSMNRDYITPRTVVTVMAARRFVVRADNGLTNSFTARLVGFDNARDNNVDACNYAYKTQAFEGFEFHVNGPLISLVFEQKKPVNLQADYFWQNVRDLTQAGIVSSPGYHGCTKVNAEQVYRQFNRDLIGDEYDLKSPSMLRVDWSVDANVTQEIVIKDMTNSERNTVKGVQTNVQIVMDNTQFANMYYNDVQPPFAFIARHTPYRN